MRDFYRNMFTILCFLLGSCITLRLIINIIFPKSIFISLADHLHQDVLFWFVLWIQIVPLIYSIICGVLVITFTFSLSKKCKILIYILVVGFLFAILFVEHLVNHLRIRDVRERLSVTSLDLTQEVNGDIKFKNTFN